MLFRCLGLPLSRKFWVIHRLYMRNIRDNIIVNLVRCCTISFLCVFHFWGAKQKINNLISIYGCDVEDIQSRGAHDRELTYYYV